MSLRSNGFLHVSRSHLTISSGVGGVESTAQFTSAGAAYLCKAVGSSVCQSAIQYLLYETRLLKKKVSHDSKYYICIKASAEIKILASAHSLVN
jgi:hypothetical protein